jgi:hypothetical protein
MPFVNFILPIGPSGVGKSTAIQERFPNAAVVSPDLVRIEIVPSYDGSGPEFDYDKYFREPVRYIDEPEVKQKISERFNVNTDTCNATLDSLIWDVTHPDNYLGKSIGSYLLKGSDVVFDATNLRAKQRLELQEIARKYSKPLKGVNVRAVAMLFTKADNETWNDYIDEVLWRNNKRRWGDPNSSDLGRRTPQIVVRRMCQGMPNVTLEQLNSEGYDEIIEIKVPRTPNETRELVFCKQYNALVNEEERRADDPHYEGLKVYKESLMTVG